MTGTNDVTTPNEVPTNRATSVVPDLGVQPTTTDHDTSVDSSANGVEQRHAGAAQGRRRRARGRRKGRAKRIKDVAIVTPDIAPAATTSNPENDSNYANTHTDKENIMQQTIEPIIAAAEAYVINPPPAPKAEIRVLQGGTGRGALLGSRFAYADFNVASERAIIRPILVDPVPGRALAFKVQLEAVGVSADVFEGRVEELATSETGNGPIVLNLDRASAIAKVLRETRGSGRAILGYLLLVTPDGQLWGIRLVLEPHETEAREALIRLFEGLAEVSERNASGAVIGPDADPARTTIEPAIRRWMAAHEVANFQKIVAGVEPVSNSVECTTDGVETRQLFVALRDQFGDPTEVAWATTANPTNPLRRGTRFVVAEVMPGAIRLHQVRRRLDDRVTVGGVEVLDPEAYDAAEKRRETERQAAAALARAERQTLSLRNPVWTTD